MYRITRRRTFALVVITVIIAWMVIIPTRLQSVASAREIGTRLLGSLRGTSPAASAAPAAPRAMFASIVVNTLDDENNIGAACSLREAIVAANTDAAFGGCTAGAGADVITFSIGLTGTIDLLAANDLLPPITTQVTIDGGGPTNIIISGDNLSGPSGLTRYLLNFSGVGAAGSSLINIGVSRGPDGNVRLFETSGVTLNNVNLFASRGDGVSLVRSNTNTITNSRIAGTGSVNNARDGINLMDSDGNTISSNDLGVNSDDGIGLETAVPPGDGSDNNMIFGNVVGPNGDSGINIIGGSDGNIIGGDVTNVLQRNRISGNISNGITIMGNSNGTQIYGNYIGTNAAGTAANPNQGAGILDINNPGAPTLIGSANPNQGNVISGNTSFGIAVALGSTATILGNRIGLAANGTVNSTSGVPNGLDGIRVGAGSGNVIIGGTAGGNLIAFNGVNALSNDGNGIGIASLFTGVATISQNSIFLNTQLGIDLDLDGVTPNDTGDPDTGANNLTNFPQLTSALISGGFVTVTGIFNSYANTSFTFELFASDTCDPSSFGEGQRFLGSTTVVTDGSGNATFNFNAPAVAGVNAYVATLTVTPTAAPNIGRTSEFSQCRIILLPTDVDFASFNATSYEGGVLAEWSTGFEADNLGFNLYREEGGRKLRVNRELVAGSALSVGARTELRAGQGYGWFDAGAAEGTQYWLEAVDLSGNSAWHGPFAVTRAERRVLNSPWSRRARTLSELGSGAGAADLTAAVEPSATIPRSLTLPRGQDANFAGREAVKVGVRRAGWYRLGQAELVAAGLSPNADPRRLQLHVDGQELAINVTGAEDGKFDATDAVEFYGMGLDTPYTDTRVYWLVAGSEPGRRLGRSEAADGAPAGRSFSYTVERRERTIYFSGLINGETENFFGAVVRADPVDQGLVLRHVDSEAGAQAELEVVLQGVTEQEHTVRVSLNGEELQPVTFRGKAQGRAVVRVAHSLLREGENTVTLQGMNGGSDISLVDHVRLTYRHLYRAEANRLSLTAQGGSVVRVGGFTRGDVRIFDVTNARAVVELGAKVAGEGAEYVAEATAAGAGQRRLLAVAGDQAWSAASLRANRASRLRQSAGGDLLVLTHESLAASAEPLIQARNSQGLRAVVADVEDVYDEFSYGHKSVGAVRDFLAHAGRNWRASPRYLLIVGDASSDPRNYLGFGDQDLVPSLNINTAVVETASDEALADFDGDGLGELMVGRLPAHTAEEAGRMVAKVLAYDRSEGSKEVALVSDVNDTYDFEGANSQVQGQLPAGLRVESIARGQLGDGAARAQLLESLGRGPKVVNYVGHGSVNFWRGNLLTAGDAAGLSNSGLSLFVTMTCLNGYFQDPALESLAEGLIKAPGGAVAVWASSGFTNPGSQEVMDVAVMRELFGSARTLGEAMRRAKASVEDPDVRRSWVLFGDPTSRLK